MRKVTIVVAMLAMLLMAAVPAFAQDIVAGDQYSIDDSFNDVLVAGAVQDVDQSIDQTQTVTGDVTGGDATATATDDSDASASGGDATVSQDASQSAVQHANDFVVWDWWWWWF